MRLQLAVELAARPDPEDMNETLVENKASGTVRCVRRLQTRLVEPRAEPQAQRSTQGSFMGWSKKCRCKHARSLVTNTLVLFLQHKIGSGSITLDP